MQDFSIFGRFGSREIKGNSPPVEDQLCNAHLIAHPHLTILIQCQPFLSQLEEYLTWKALLL